MKRAELYVILKTQKFNSKGQGAICTTEATQKLAGGNEGRTAADGFGLIHMWSLYN